MKSLSAVCAWLVVAIALTPVQPAAAQAKMVSSGAGFFVSKNGHLLTNFHVVESCRQPTIQSRHSTGSANVVALDPANDLALLATNLKPVRIADWHYSVRDGEPAVVYGFPHGADRVANGTVLGLTGWHNSKLLYLEAGIEPGMSGSAIIDRGGRVIGINIGDINRKIGAAVTSSAAAALLDAHGVAHAEANETKPVPVSDVIEKAKAISAQVICDSNGRKTDAQVCRRSGGVSASDEMIIDACGRAIASGKIGGETLRSMYSQRAGAHLRKHQFDLAKSDCDEAFKIVPRDSDNFRCRAHVYAAKGEYDRAITELDEAIRIFPKDTIALSMRAGAYFSKGEFGHAIADLDRAIQIDPDYAGAIWLRGTIFDNRREHARAVADFDRAITIYDEWIKLYALPVIRADFLTQRGNTYNAKGDRDRAIADYDQAIRLDPNNVKIFYSRGTAYNAKGDRNRAITDYDQAIRLDPNSANAFNNRGNAHNATGDRDRAIADYDQANPARSKQRKCLQQPRQRLQCQG
jgi:tetratricopeptide (TPR) repeat protein